MGKHVSSAALAALLILAVFAFAPVAAAASYEALNRPWSGYWWPDTQGGLATGIDYRGKPAPLEKYNLLTAGRTSGTALSAYLETHYDPNAPVWYGLCAYWARAAAYEHIDIRPSAENNIIFRVGDKKGLLTLAHNSDILDLGSGSFPEEFHFWLLSYIKDQKRAFAADLDGGAQVWSYPVYKYDMSSLRNGNVESVSVRIYYADDFVEPDYRGTQVRWADYTYNLFLDGTGAIIGGEWTGASVADHPDLMSVTLDVQTVFPGLDYQELLRIARSVDDPLERGGEPVDIGPGTYNLVLLDEDVYRIAAATGDTLALAIEKLPGSGRDLDVAVLDGTGAEVHQAVVSTGNPETLLFTALAPPYTVRVRQDDYSDPNLYALRLDQRRLYSQEIPYVPKGNAWSGFALTNAGSTAVEGVTLTTRKGAGTPIQTVLGPLSLGPGEKRVFLFDDLAVRLHEYPDTEQLTLTAGGPVELLNLIGESDRFLATLVQGDSRGSLLVIPDTAPPMTPGVRMFGAVRNESFAETRVRLRLYSSAGELLKEVADEPIAGQGRLFIEPGTYPFYSMPAAGWIEVQGDGQQTLSGYQYTADSSGVETLYALPVSPGKKVVPHVPEPGYWTTRLTLINPNDTENPVKLHAALAGADGSGDLDIVLAPREKRVLEIQELFGKREGDPLYHSIVEITGGYPLSGYFTYSTVDITDDASYPLLDQTRYKSTLVLPHYPGDGGYWWTGAVVCNPAAVPVQVRIEPYDHAGNLLEPHVQSVDLAAGAYDVFDVASRFGAIADAISFIKFRAADAGQIGGFYLYGDRGNRILSGSAM